MVGRYIEQHRRFRLQDEERQIRALKDAKIDFISGDKITATSNFNSRPELFKILKKWSQDRFSLLLIQSLKLSIFVPE